MAEHAGALGKFAHVVESVVVAREVAVGIHIHFLNSHKIRFGGFNLTGETVHVGQFAEAQIIGHHAQFPRLVRLLHKPHGEFRLVGGDVVRSMVYAPLYVGFAVDCPYVHGHAH